MINIKRFSAFLIVFLMLVSALGVGSFADTASDVDALIEAIGEVNIHSYKKITTAREAYNALGDEEKNNVTNIDKLVAAEESLAVIYSLAADTDHSIAYDATRGYLSKLGTPSVGSVGGEWMVIALCRDGEACPEGYYENVVEYVNAKINEKGQLHRAKSTDNSRVILALTSAGYDVTNVGGHNLLRGLCDMTYLKKQGINGPIWALIALDSKDYDIPTDPDAAEQATREGIISYILEKQLEDGGWAMSGKSADPDMTGMAIQSLAPYYAENEDVKAAVDKALETLSNIQLDNGGYGSVDGSCSESCVQVIVGLTSLGIDPETDPRFTKNGISVLDALCVFAMEGGGFAHVPNAGLNGMATEQGQYALVSYFRLLSGKTSIYDMSDVTLGEEDTIPPEEDETTAPEDTTVPEDTTIPEDTTAPEVTTAPEDTTVPEDTIVSEDTTTPVTTSRDKNTTASTTKPTTSPQTGDRGIGICIAFMAISALGAIFTIYRKYSVN